MSQLISELSRRASNGDINAMKKLGYVYEKGDGTGKDIQQAVFWYEKAADRGDVMSMFNIGCIYDDGLIGTYEEAIQWYEKAAAKGSVSALHNLGFCYQRGHGVQTNYAKAVEYYQKSSKKGVLLSYYNMGLCYMHGDSHMEKDYNKAAICFNVASGGGDVDATVYLGTFYQQGLGVEQNIRKAVELFETAALNGSWAATEALADMFSKGKYGVVKNTRKAQILYLSAQLAAEGQNMKSLATLRSALDIKTDYDESSDKMTNNNMPDFAIIPNTVFFKSNNGTDKLKFFEGGMISLQVKNNTTGVANNLLIKVNSSSNYIKIKEVKLPVIPAGQSLMVDVPLLSSNLLESGTAVLEILLTDLNTVCKDSFELSVQTIGDENISTDFAYKNDSTQLNVVAENSNKKDSLNETTLTPGVPSSVPAVADVNIKSPSQILKNNNGKTPSVQVLPGSSRFVYKSGNNYLNPDETCKLTFKVFNKSSVTSDKCTVNLYTQNANIIAEAVEIPTLQPGQMKELEMYVNAGKHLCGEKASVEIFVKDSNGNVSVSEKLEIPLATSQKSYFEISDFNYSSDSGRIKKMQPVKITLMLHNKQYVPAKNVSVSIDLPDGVMFIDGRQTTVIDELTANGLKVLSYVIITNSTYDAEDIPLKIRIQGASEEMKADKVMSVHIDQ